MASIPVRLSAQLATDASKEAKFQDRSITEQVEHWARLGRIVEAAVSASTVARLKALSYDAQLPDRLARVRTPEGRAAVASFIASQNPVRYEERNGRIVKLSKKKR
jgi:hypothetical protein